jgi:hypothetical protein
MAAAIQVKGQLTAAQAASAEGPAELLEATSQPHSVAPVRPDDVDVDLRRMLELGFRESHWIRNMVAVRVITLSPRLLAYVKAKVIPFWNHLASTASLARVAATPAKKKSLFSPRYDEFLKLLREARIAAGLSQRGAAKKLNRTQSFISKSESGERRVDVIELVDFLRAYGVRPDKFIKKL